MKTKEEAPEELSAVQKAPSFLWANCLRHWRIVEIVGGHVNPPDIPYRGQFAAGLLKIFLAITVSITVSSRRRYAVRSTSQKLQLAFQMGKKAGRFLRFDEAVRKQLQ